MSRPCEPIERRFWKYVRKSNDCWEWIGAKRGGGYGALWTQGRNGHHTPAHRISWIIHYGRIPYDMLVLHKCNNKGCIRPEHLYLGTIHDNIMDAIKAGFQPFNGKRALGERNANAKLRLCDVDAIRQRYRGGASSRILAKEYGVDKSTILRLIHYETWKQQPKNK